MKEKNKTIKYTLKDFIDYSNNLGVVVVPIMETLKLRNFPYIHNMQIRLQTGYGG